MQNIVSLEDFLESKTIEKQITEKDFRQTVIEAAQLTGWKVYFTWNSLHSPAGFPDLVLCRGSRLIIAELKSESGKVSQAQDEWITALLEVRNWNMIMNKVISPEVFIWRPRDLDKIIEVLK